MMNVLDVNNEQIQIILENLDSISNQLNQFSKEYVPLFEGEHYLTNEQLSRLLQTDKRTLQEYRNKGLISYIDSGKILYKESDILKMLDKKYIEAWNK